MDYLKRFLFLSEYDTYTDKNLINEKINKILESKKTEKEAFNILEKNNINDIDKIIDQFKKADKTKNQILLPIMSKYLVDIGDENKIDDVLKLFDILSNLINKGKIKTPQISNNKYIIGDKSFSNFLDFSQYIEGIEHMNSGYKNLIGKIEDVETYEKPIETGDNIEIYDGNDVGKCIKYTTGGLTGHHYSFCIGQPGNTMWQSYRDRAGSTFYYVIDKNREINDPLHIVVVDVNNYNGIYLTDANNDTGNIKKYGNNYEEYFKYLKNKGVDISIFKNKPKTNKEKKEDEKLGKENNDLNWFRNLSYEEKSKYIGRGHLLSDEQFKWLWKFKDSDGGFKLLHQYLDTGQPIPKSQYEILIGKKDI